MKYNILKTKNSKESHFHIILKTLIYSLFLLFFIGFMAHLVKKSIFLFLELFRKHTIDIRTNPDVPEKLYKFKYFIKKIKFYKKHNLKIKSF